MRFLIKASCVLFLIIFSACGAEKPIGEQQELTNNFNESYTRDVVSGEAPPIQSPVDALSDARTLAGIVKFLYESKVDPEGYNPLVIHCADDKFYQITFPEQMGPDRAEIFIGDFIVVKLTEDWAPERYTYDGNLWRNITQRLVYFQDENVIQF